jgi:predicted ATPase
VLSGLQRLRTGLDELREARSALRFMAFLSELADGLGRTGQIAQGLSVIEKAIERSEATEERWSTAELLRVKGELVLLEDARNAAAAAERHFQQALDWARRQGALSWELRTATSIARLWRKQGRTTDARTLMVPVYGRFTEGFDSADLRAAKALIDDLG